MCVKILFVQNKEHEHLVHTVREGCVEEQDEACLRENVKNQQMSAAIFSASCIVVYLLCYKGDDNPPAKSQKQQKKGKKRKQT